jgi:molybdopterin-containing oxidoreductase family membrane subunit
MAEGSRMGRRGIAMGGAARRVASGGPLYLLCVAGLGLLTLIGIAAGIHALFIVGSRQAYGTYREIPLAMLISAYAFFIGASTGLYLLASIGHVFGVREFRSISRRAVYLSMVTILAGYLIIGLEIENPLRMVIYSVLSPNLASNIWWMGILYSGYLLFMAVSFAALMTRQHRIAAFTGLAALLSVVAADSNMGAVFAMMHGRDYWYGPFLPVYFIASALMTGCAFLIFFTLLAARLRRERPDPQTAETIGIVSRLAMLMLSIVLFFNIWKVLTGIVGSPGKVMATGALLAGPYAFNFWGLEVLGGTIVPFILFLMAKGKRNGMMLAASALMIFCSFFMRLDLVVVGQIVPAYMELGVAEYSRIHTYTPSWHEILVVLGGAGLCGFAFLIGEKIFNGFGAPDGEPRPAETAIPDGNLEKAP